MAQQKPMRRMAATIAAVLSLASCSKPLGVAEAKAQVAPYQSKSEYAFLCDAEKREAFRVVVKDYARAIQADGTEWPNRSRGHPDIDWITRVSLAGLIAGFIRPSDFANASSDMSSLLHDVARKAKSSDTKERMASSVGIEVITTMPKSEVKAAAEYACPELIAYANALAEAEYVERVAFGPQDNNHDEAQDAVDTYNKHIGRMLDLKKQVLNKSPGSS